jgi:hypothetical protein
MEIFTPKVSHLKSLWLPVFLIIFSINARAQGAGHALYFDGSNTNDRYVNVNSAIGTVHTIEFWVNSDIELNGGTGQPAFYFNSDNNQYIWLNSSTSSITGETVGFSVGNTANRTYTTQNMPVGWNHIAIVSDGTRYTNIYINGKPATVVTPSGYDEAPVISISNMQIGARSSSNHFYKGYLDEIRFWSSSRSQTEIRDNMCKKLAGNETGLLAYYNFDDGSGTTATDLTGNANGTLTGRTINTLVRRPFWVPSTAPIGDEVEYSYSVSTSTQLDFDGASGVGFELDVNSVTSASSLFLYKVNAAPNFNLVGSGLEMVSNTDYYGVWSPDASGLTFDIDYDFTGYNGMSDASKMKLAKRTDAKRRAWEDQSASRTSNLLEVNGATQGQFILASSGTNTIGTFASSTIYNTEQGAGSCLSFDGSNDHVLIEDHEVMQPSSEFTFEAWIYTETSAYRRIISKWDGNSRNGDDAGAIGMDTYDGNSNGLGLRFWGYYSYNNQWWSTPTSGTVLSLNTWHHVAGTYDNGTVKLYLDGELLYTVNTNETTIPDSDFDWGIGEENPDGNNEFFDGYMDEVRIWTEALDQSTLQEYMLKKIDGNHPNIAGLGAYFNFDENDGSYTYDKSGNNIAGYLDGPSWTTTSTAPIGDDCIRLDDPSTTVGHNTVNLAHANGVDLSADVQAGTADALYLYRVDGTPNSVLPPNGINQLSNNHYWGVFTTGESSFEYDLTLNYDGHPNISYEDGLALANRTNAGGAWAHASTATLNTTANTLLEDDAAEGEYILASKNGNEIGDDPSNAANVIGSGGCLELYGNDEYIRLDDLADDLAGQDMTFEAWVTNTTDGQAIIGINSSSGGNVMILNRNLVYDVTANGGNNNHYDFSTKITDNEWHHLAVVLESGDALRVYLDGEEVVNLSHSTLAISATDQISFGQEFDGTSKSQFVDGYLDEMRVWKTALTQAEIREWMCQKPTSSHPEWNNLLAYYQFEEQSGSTIYDSKNGNHMSLLGSPGWVNHSGAHIGSQVDFDNTITSSSANLSLAHANGDDMTLDFTAGTAKGVYLYRVDDAANWLVGPSGAGHIARVNHWGVFVVEPDGSFEYTNTYNYDGHPDIQTEANLKLLSRDDAQDLSWTDLSATVNTTDNDLEKSGNTSGQQWALASSSGNSFGVFVLTEHTPVNGKFNVALDGTITFTFSQDVKNTQANLEHIKVIGELTGKLSCATSVSGGVVTLTPAEDFKPGEKIRLWVTTDLVNTSDENLEAPYAFSFNAGATEYPENPSTWTKTTVAWQRDDDQLPIGDINGDGFVDIGRVHGTQSKVYYYKNDGAGNFSAEEIGSTGSHTSRRPTAFVFTDLDMDGDLDVVTFASYSTSFNFYWFENDGVGNFQRHTLTNPSYNMDKLFAVDYDMDGDMDLVYIYSSSSGRIYVLENNGNQTFTEKLLISRYVPEYVSLEDLNGDGLTDLLAGHSSHKNRISLSNGDGTFQLELYNSAAPLSRVYNTHIADIDQDGMMDLVSCGDDGVMWAEHDGALGFTNNTVHASSNNWDGLRAHDLNADGYVDIIGKHRNGDDAFWYKNDGSQNFSIETIYNNATTNKYAEEIQIADFNGDGYLDYVETSSEYINLYIPEFPALELTSITPNANALNIATNAVIALEFNLSVDASTLASGIKVYGEQSGMHSVQFAGGGTTDITVTPDDPFFAGEKVSVSLTLALQDAADGYTMEKGLSYQFMVASGEYPLDEPDVYRKHVVYANAGLPQTIQFADIDADGDMDMVSASNATSNQHVSAFINTRINNGKIKFARQTVFDPSYNGAITTAIPVDFDMNGVMDVATNYYYGGDSRFYLRYKSGASWNNSSLWSPSHKYPKNMCAADFEGDGDNDIIVTFNSTDRIDLIRRVSGHGAAVTNVVTSFDNPQDVFAGDFNEDGHMDIIACSYHASTGKVSLFVNNKNLGFTETVIESNMNLPRKVFATDLNGDGDLDILVAEEGANKIRYFENDGNMSTLSFTEGTSISSVGGVSCIYATDVNGDGVIDIVAAMHDDDEIAWWQTDNANPSSLSFSKRSITTYATGARWVHVADIDGDGDMDFASASEDDNTIAWYLAEFETGWVWNGNSSNTFATSGNWQNTKSPGKDINVEIPTGQSRYPTVNADIEINDIELGTGASIQVAQGNTLTITGDIINNTGGTLDFGDGTVELKGTAAQNFNGAIKGNIIINNPNDVSLGGNSEIVDLTLTEGDLVLGTNNLTLSGTIAHGSADSYIKIDNTGVVKVTVGSSPVIVPVGRNPYMPVVLDDGGNNEFEISMSENVYLDPDAQSGTMTGEYVTNTWTITNNGSTANAVSVTLIWDENEVSASSVNTGTAGIGFWQSGTSTTWDGSFIGTPTNGSISGTKELTRTGITLIGGETYFFGVGEGSGTPLPVEFTQFNASWLNSASLVGQEELAERSRRQALLNWQTAMEENNSHFEVERSFDGINYETIGRVEGAGSTFETTDYQFIDQLETRNTKLTSRDIRGETIYYRLKQVDYNGMFEYSQTQTLNFKQETLNSLTVYPNPAQNQISITAEGFGASQFDIMLFNAQGVLVGSFYNTSQIDVSELKSGIYTLSILHEQKVFNELVIIER